MVTSDISKVESSYTYDTLGNLIYEKEKNVKTDYQYNELNQLVSRKQGNESYTYSYDKRGNRIAEAGKKETREYIYDETNHLVEGTNWKGDKSAYTYNGLDVRINNTQTAHSGSVYSRDYVIDYTSLERDDLMVFAEGDGQLDYVQREVYAGSERIEQFTDRSNGGYERLLYVHEDLMGNTRYYTKANGQSYAELTYDAWGMPESPNKLLNNDHGNYVYATYTGHIFDTTLDIYFAEARFYDANTRTWLAMDPIKDGDNWYQYCYSNPLKYWDPTGLRGFSIWECLDVNSITDWFHTEWNNMQDVLGRIGQGALGVLQSVLSAAQVIMGGTAAIAAIAGLAGASSVALPILIMTLVGGGISAVFGGSNFIEGINMIKNAIEGNDEVARNPIRDDYFSEYPWLYNLIDVIAGWVSAYGTTSIIDSFSNNYWKSISVSDKKMYQLGDHYTKHGKNMGYGSKKEYEAAARQFFTEKSSTAEIYEGIWNSSRGQQSGELQIIIRNEGKQLIINKNTGQIIDFYEGTSLDGFIKLEKVQ